MQLLYPKLKIKGFTNKNCPDKAGSILTNVGWNDIGSLENAFFQLGNVFSPERHSTSKHEIQ